MPRSIDELCASALGSLGQLRYDGAAMAEQFIKAFTIDLSALSAVVGARDDELLASLLAHDLAEEVASLVGDCDLDLEEVLSELSRGELDPAHADGYRRSLELFAGVVGRPIDQWEAIMPGRGWHELGPAFAGWDQPWLAAHWGGASSGNPSYPWPWAQSDPSRDADWPVALAVQRDDLAAVRAELDSFDSRIIVERGVPKSIDRFGDPAHWPLDELASDLDYAVKVLRAFLGEATAAGTDLLLWHDGSQ